MPGNHWLARLAFLTEAPHLECCAEAPDLGLEGAEKPEQVSEEDQDEEEDLPDEQLAAKTGKQLARKGITFEAKQSTKVWCLGEAQIPSAVERLQCEEEVLQCLPCWGFGRLSAAGCDYTGKEGRTGQRGRARGQKCLCSSRQRCWQRCPRRQRLKEVRRPCCAACVRTSNCPSQTTGIVQSETIW